MLQPHLANEEEEAAHLHGGHAGRYPSARRRISGGRGALQKGPQRRVRCVLDQRCRQLLQVQGRSLSCANPLCMALQGHQNEYLEGPMPCACGSVQFGMNSDSVNIKVRFYSQERRSFA